MKKEDFMIFLAENEPVYESIFCVLEQKIYPTEKWDNSRIQWSEWRQRAEGLLYKNFLLKYQSQGFLSIIRNDKQSVILA